MPRRLLQLPAPIAGPLQIGQGLAARPVVEPTHMCNHMAFASAHTRQTRVLDFVASRAQRDQPIQALHGVRTLQLEDPLLVTIRSASLAVPNDPRVANLAEVVGARADRNPQRIPGFRVFEDSAQVGTMGVWR